ncbi:hypothetical protein L1887_07072 [Cichorium endivia]|nr:hypothetical protein L1887_07072 [Cichorium endivia]
MCERNGKSKVSTPDTVRLTVKASEALVGTLPKKEKDPGSPLITTTVGDLVIRNTLLDLGASVNILPGYLYDKYKNEEIEPAKVVLQLADQSTKVSRGKGTNVIVKVGDFFYHVDFLVMEYESLDDAPALILGRPFLATAGVVIDCKTGDIDISFGTRKRRVNMFGNPVSLPSEDDGKQLDKNVNHPLATIDKEQLLDMMEMLEARHQQYEKESREREAKMMFRLDHDFLQFPKGPATSIDYTSRREALVGRPVLEATVIDRDILRDVGLWGAIRPFLHHTWTHGEASFTCRGWDMIMATEDDIVYTELLLEFISTIQYAPRASDPRSRMLRFRLGGEQRECNLRKFGRRVGLYTPADLQHRHFTQFLGACIQG